MPDKLLEIHDLSKKYGDVTVLDNVSISVNRNEIVGLVGENGAGKSTIMNVLCGVTGGWSGEVRLHGQPLRPRDYHHATLLGIARVFQEQALVPTIKVYENMLLSHEDRFRRFGVFLDRRRMAALARKRLSEFGLEIDVARLTGDYDFSTRQAIEIAKACHICELLTNQLPLILLDEPTAALNQHEVETFFERLRLLKTRASVIFVSHRLSEILELCDRIYVLKDGCLVAEVLPGQVSEGKLHELMVGRKRDQDYYKEDRQQAPSAAPLLSIQGFTRRGEFEDVSFDLLPGEIVGIGGLLGSGKTALGRSLAGIEDWDAGEILIQGRPVRHADLVNWMGKHSGYVPQERLREGIIPYHSVAWNIGLGNFDNISGTIPGSISPRRERALANVYARRLAIKPPNPRALAVRLSGGNQQKVVLAKWLARKPKILILDSPTRGMDAGAKEEIYSLLRELTNQRDPMAILLISDELLELIGMSHRILVMKDGRVTHRVEAPPQNKPTEREMVRFMV